MTALLLATLTASAAHAADEADEGFLKMPLGKVTVIALSDGRFTLPASTLMVEARKGEVQEALSKAHLSDDVPTSVNAFLIDTGDKRILIDTGSGAFLGATLGQVSQHLQAAGYRPDQIDEVLITHLHADHVGGLIDRGRMVYPNAIVRVDAREKTFWEDRRNVGQVDASVKATFDAVATALKPYEAIGHVKTLASGETVGPGITAWSEPGHTAGHTGYRIVSDGKVLLVWGDLVHLAAAQFPDPKVTIRFDSTPADAVRSREKALAAASKSGYLVAGAHMAFPGIGTVGKAGSAYTWTPVER
ncbi:MBL fold metallo-hydrolase [Luteibacter aegosomatis]|uniref:MBL fold metallo-hydrolase n=1 Tax=Luteibacter aegosomatis TaxID=2911537 RepID=UPI001FF81491|nr:MBL fold metallo-hydrolase [Luteibacter aegosomatis]UPG83938.1 MBL fold metallo-hydrolase [Luteibacter aegosomatis]